MSTKNRERNQAISEQQVRFAVRRTPRDKMVRVPARDLMFAYQTLGELVRFFHQPLHWQTLDDVKRFIGDRHGGAFRLIWDRSEP